MPKRLLGQRKFEQTLQIGDVVALLNTSGFIADPAANTPFFEVTAADGVPLLGRHGMVLLYTEGSVPAGYLADANAATGAITAGASITVQPQALALSRGQLLQFRLRFKVLATLGVAYQDIDVTASQPASVLRWRVGATSQGVLNSIGQVQDPSDQTVLPAQNANEALPAVFPSENEWDAAYRSELWTYYDQNPSFTFLNNGSGSTSGGGFGFEIAGHIYNLRALEATSARQATILGYGATVPVDLDVRNDVTIIQVAGRSVY